MRFGTKILSGQFLLIILVHVADANPSALYTCVDWECEEWISRGKTMLRYSAKTDKHLSFQRNEDISILSKPVDKSLTDWVGKIGDRVGLVPRDMVREDKMNKSPPKFKLELHDIPTLMKQHKEVEEDDEADAAAGTGDIAIEDIDETDATTTAPLDSLVSVLETDKKTEITETGEEETSINATPSIHTGDESIFATSTSVESLESIPIPSSLDKDVTHVELEQDGNVGSESPTSADHQHISSDPVIDTINLEPSTDTILESAATAEYLQETPKSEEFKSTEDAPSHDYTQAIKNSDSVEDATNVEQSSDTTVLESTATAEYLQETPKPEDQMATEDAAYYHTQATIKDSDSVEDTTNVQQSSDTVLEEGEAVGGILPAETPKPEEQMATEDAAPDHTQAIKDSDSVEDNNITNVESDTVVEGIATAENLQEAPKPEEFKSNEDATHDHTHAIIKDSDSVEDTANVELSSNTIFDGIATAKYLQDAPKPEEFKSTEDAAHVQAQTTIKDLDSVEDTVNVELSSDTALEEGEAVAGILPAEVPIPEEQMATETEDAAHVQAQATIKDSDSVEETTNVELSSDTVLEGMATAEYLQETPKPEEVKSTEDAARDHTQTIKDSDSVEDSTNVDLSSDTVLEEIEATAGILPEAPEPEEQVPTDDAGHSSTQATIMDSDSVEDTTNADLPSDTILEGEGTAGILPEAPQPEEQMATQDSAHDHDHAHGTIINDSESSSITLVIRHLSLTLLSFLPEPLQDTILDVDDALVFTGIIALTLVSICVPYFLIEGYMSVRPLKKKVVELNKSLWKVSAAYETQQEEFDIFKQKAMAHDEFKKRADQSENDVLILKKLETKHREQITALKTQLKTQMTEAVDIRALIEKTLEDKKVVLGECEKFKAAYGTTKEALVAAREELNNIQTQTKSSALLLNVSSKNVEVLNSKISMLQQEAEEMKSQLEAESEKRKGVEIEKQEVEQAKSAVERELSEFKHICHQYEGTVSGLNDEISKLESELATIKEALGEDSPLLEVAEIQAKAAFSEKEADSLRTRLEGLTADNENLNGKVRTMTTSLDEANNERDQTCNRLQVLEAYFKEREEEYIKTIEQLQLKESVRDKGKEELIRIIEENENVCKDLNERLEALKEEFEETKQQHRNEIRGLEAKGHENWLSLCQAERKAQDARKEAKLLRQRLTALTKEKDDEDGDGLNGEVPMLFPVLPDELVPLPIMDDPPSYFGLGGDFVPPPPLPEGGEREPHRPPPLGGRLSPSFSDVDDISVLSPIGVGRRDDDCTDGSSGSDSPRRSSPLRGGWVNVPHDRQGQGSESMRRLSRATSSPIQPGANL